MLGTTPESGEDVAVVASSKMVLGVSGGSARTGGAICLLLLFEFDQDSERLDEDLYECEKLV